MGRANAYLERTNGKPQVHVIGDFRQVTLREVFHLLESIFQRVLVHIQSSRGGRHAPVVMQPYLQGPKELRALPGVVLDEGTKAVVCRVP